MNFGEGAAKAGKAVGRFLFGSPTEMKRLGRYTLKGLKNPREYVGKMGEIYKHPLVMGMTVATMPGNMLGDKDPKKSNKRKWAEWAASQAIMAPVSHIGGLQKGWMASGGLAGQVAAMKAVDYVGKKVDEKTKTAQSQTIGTTHTVFADPSRKMSVKSQPKQSIPTAVDISTSLQNAPTIFSQSPMKAAVTGTPNPLSLS